MPEQDQTIPAPGGKRFDVTVDYRLFVRGQSGVDSTTRLGPGDTLRALPLDDGTELRIVRTGGEPERRDRPIADAIAALVRDDPDLLLAALIFVLFFSVVGLAVACGSP